jgi:hypothetical protein
MSTAIKNALNCLDQADFSGFFRAIKNEVPAQHRTQFSALQGEFISGKSAWDFNQRLKSFADTLTQTPVSAPSTPASVSPDNSTGINRPLRVFISFSENEKRSKEYSLAIKKHLGVLIRNNQIQVWSRSDLGAGVLVTPKIRQELEQADVFVALMSSEYFYDEQVQQLDEVIALRRHAEGSLIVVPVILRPYNWEYTWLKDFSPLPSDKNPIKSPENDEAWTELETLLRAILN